MSYLSTPTLVLSSKKVCGHAGGKAVWTLDGAGDHVEFTWVEEPDLASLLASLSSRLKEAENHGSAAEAERELIQISTDSVADTGQKVILPFGNMRRSRADREQRDRVLDVLENR
ncbi:MAG: hypothetical protein ACOC0Y_02005 [Spirochaetota bacterium]